MWPLDFVLDLSGSWSWPKKNFRDVEWRRKCIWINLGCLHQRPQFFRSNDRRVERYISSIHSLEFIVRWGYQRSDFNQAVSIICYFLRSSMFIFHLHHIFSSLYWLYPTEICQCLVRMAKWSSVFHLVILVTHERQTGVGIKQITNFWCDIFHVFTIQPKKKKRKLTNDKMSLLSPERNKFKLNFYRSSILCFYDASAENVF